MLPLIENFRRKKISKFSLKLKVLNIDMAPMVGLLGLILTFFVLTSALAKPKVMPIVLPEKHFTYRGCCGTGCKIRTLNVFLTKNNKLFWFKGVADPNKKKDEKPVLNKTDFSENGIRKLLLSVNKDLVKKIYDLRMSVLRGEKNFPPDSLAVQEKLLQDINNFGPIVLIKATNSATYGNLVDLIDELNICSIGRYAIVSPSDYELELLKEAEN